MNEASAQHSCKVLGYQDPNQGYLDTLIDRGLLQRESLRRVDCRAANAVEPQPPEAGSFDFKSTVKEFEIALLRRALEQNQFNQKKSAETLSLSYHQLRGYLRKYDLLG